MVFRDSPCYTAGLMLLFLMFMVSVFQLLIKGEYIFRRLLAPSSA